MSVMGTSVKASRTPLIVLALLSVFGPSLAHANPILVIQPVIAGSLGVATPDIARDLLFATAIYGQVSIDVSLLPTDFDASLATNFVENTAGILPFVTSSTYEFAPILTVFYVATINGSTSNRGTSTCFGGRCAVWIANSAANDTFAHELAHILTGFQALWDENPSDPSHSTDPTNLLAPGSIRNVPSSTADITAGVRPSIASPRIRPPQCWRAATPSRQFPNPSLSYL